MEQVFFDVVDVNEINVVVVLVFVCGLDVEGGIDMFFVFVVVLCDKSVDDIMWVCQVVFLIDGVIGNEVQLFEVIYLGIG